jgi:hypothetical protein
VKLAAGAFLAGASSRLLPVSIPFRFFGAAVAYHLLAWLALLAGIGAAPAFAGGLGWSLAALHLVTLGVLAMAAIGASLQLLPVATRQPVRFRRWPAAIWWLYTPGVAALALGMGTGGTRLLAVGAIAVVIALVAFAVLLADNLCAGRGMPAVVAHGWVAMASLLVTLATALALAGGYLGAPVLDRANALPLHVVFAAYGFMGMLALGLSYVLVPMFALAPAPDERQAFASGALGAIALLVAAVAALGVAPRPLFIAAIAFGSGSVALHLRLMRIALRTGMRRALGRSFRLVRIAWALLVASLAAGLAMALQLPIEHLSALFGLTLIAGWLLTFLLGILQRIVPFLASMHAARGKGLPPTPSALTAERPLTMHFLCHLAALALLALAVITDSVLVAAGGAVAGAAGAMAYCWFFLVVLRRMRRLGSVAAVGVAGAV